MHLTTLNLSTSFSSMATNDHNSCHVDQCFNIRLEIVNFAFYKSIFCQYYKWISRQVPFQNSSHTALSCAEPFCKIKLKNVFAWAQKNVCLHFLFNTWYYIHPLLVLYPVSVKFKVLIMIYHSSSCVDIFQKISIQFNFVLFSTVQL